MKTELEREAEIALDVKKAKRERAEAEHTALMALRQELAKEERTKRKVRKEKLASFLYSLAVLFMTSSGIGGLTPILTNSYQPQNWYGLVGGVFVSAILAYKANNILKY